MTPKEYASLSEGSRVKQTSFTKFFKKETKSGNVMKIYNDNHQCLVLFEGERQPRVVEYTQIEVAQ